MGISKIHVYFETFRERFVKSVTSVENLLHFCVMIFIQNTRVLSKKSSVSWIFLLKFFVKSVVTFYVKSITFFYQSASVENEPKTVHVHNFSVKSTFYKRSCYIYINSWFHGKYECTLFRNYGIYIFTRKNFVKIACSIFALISRNFYEKRW